MLPFSKGQTLKKFALQVQTAQNISSLVTTMCTRVQGWRKRMQKKGMQKYILILAKDPRVN